MAKPVTHFSRIRTVAGRTITGTLCNRMAGAGDINCTEVLGEVTCKLCLREFNFQLAKRPNCYSRARGSVVAA